jgi:tetratricopeptide (TPR) repeat protein
VLIGVFCISTTSIFGMETVTHTQKTVKTSPSETLFQEDFKKALLLYQSNNFKESYKLFSTLFEKKSDDAEINFYLGRCATELKLYDEALGAYDRVLILDPNHTRTKIELGRVYFEQKDYEQAQDTFSEALNEDIPNEVKEQINKFLVAIENAHKSHTINGAFIVGVSYDTNVKNSPDKLPWLGGNEQIKDNSLSETLSLNHIYKPYRKNYAWNNSLVLYNQNYEDTQDSNIFYGQFSSGVNYSAQNYEVAFTPVYERLVFGGVSMMEALGVGIKYSNIVEEGMILEQNLGTKRQFFNNENKLMNANLLEYSGTLKTAIDKDKIFSVGFLATRNKDIYEGRTDVNQHSRALKLDFTFPIEKVNINTNFLLKKLNYDNTDGVYNDVREDLSRTYGVTFTRPITGSILVSVSANRVENESNFQTNRYQKNTYTFSVIQAF